MTKTLGLDLGTNSIGWALVENKNTIRGIGVRIFPEGVDNLGDGQNEQSKNSVRRAFRQIRRQIFRRKLRKKILLKQLAKYQMCPLNDDQIKLWYKTGDFPDSQEMRSWLKENPYLLRAKALKEQITLMQLGRILYQIAQHRGFLSNSRSASSDEKEEGAIYKGDEKEGKTGITETEQSIGESTLGNYLASIYPAENKSYTDAQTRIRNRYTTRQMYINEFECIWQAQKKYHSQLTDEMKEALGGRKKDGYTKDGVLFFQRPLRTQKHLVGKCTFEPTKTRCPASAIPFELFRAYQFINQIECDGKNLDAEDRKIALDILLTKEKPKFKEIRKKFKQPGAHFNYEDDDTCPGTWTISNLSHKKFFGAKWPAMSAKQQEDIWHILFFFDDRDKLKEYAKTKWKFEEEQAIKISKFNLDDGYANLSRKAILNILPFLETGNPYDVAVALGGIKNAFGDNWSKLDKKSKDFLITNVYEIVRAEIKGGYIGALKEFLKKEFGLNEEQLSKLYHHSTSVNKADVIPTLPLGKEADKEISGLRNPIVITALFELRKLVNEIINEYGAIDEIKVELARDLKVSKEKRNKVRLEQKRLERQNDELVKKLRDHSQIVSHKNILKLKLYEECQHTCPYTGKEISIQQLFSGNVQIEHIFPWSRSTDDSFLNKTLCFSEANIEKGERTPYEFFSQKGNEKWEEFKKRALSLFTTTKEFPMRYEKFKRLVAEKFDEDFVSRQLNDTRYISKEAKSYLEKVCSSVKVAPGQMTANLRSNWGLNSILNIEDDEKNRNDHRHHAIDALVMACFEQSHLQEISKWNRYNRQAELKNFLMPWNTFRADAGKLLNAILISYKQTNKVMASRNYKIKKEGETYINKGAAAKGKLHEATIYGLRKDKQGETAFHIRKPLKALTEATIPKIVDDRVRVLVYERLAERGLTIDPKSKKPITKPKEEEQKFKSAFDTPIYLPNKNGDPVPVRKVRIKEDLTKAVSLKKKINQYVNPKNNHHLLIYRKHNGELNYDAVSFWTAVERKKQRLPVVALPENGKEIVSVFQKNDLYLLTVDREEFEKNKTNYDFMAKHLYRVRSVAGGGYFMEVCFRHHSDARTDKEAKADYKYIKNFGDGKTGWDTLKPIKVELTPTGHLKLINHAQKNIVF